MRQEVDGFDLTIVSGVVTRRHDQPTGALPGRLVRGPGYRGGTSTSQGAGYALAEAK
jgi:N-acyl-D-aspartate/D-glutamate deacylase